MQRVRPSWNVNRRTTIHAVNDSSFILDFKRCWAFKSSSSNFFRQRTTVRRKFGASTSVSTGRDKPGQNELKNFKKKDQISCFRTSFSCFRTSFPVLEHHFLFQNVVFLFQNVLFCSVPFCPVSRPGFWLSRPVPSRILAVPARPVPWQDFWLVPLSRDNFPLETLPHTRPTSTSKFTNLKKDVNVIDIGYNDSKNLDALNLSNFFGFLHVFTQSLTSLSFVRKSVLHFLFPKTLDFSGHLGEKSKSIKRIP